MDYYNLSIIEKVKNLKSGITFENSRLEMNYTIHKFFDVVIYHKNLVNDEIVIKIPLKSSVIPVFIDFESYAKDNNKIWSQEYKVHFDLSVITKNDYHFMKLKVDRVTKPLRVFKKEYSNVEVMQEIRRVNNV